MRIRRDGRMLAYYGVMLVIGVASVTAGPLSAVAFGVGYAVCGVLGLQLRWRRAPTREAWIIVALAILSAGQGVVLWLGDSPDGGPAEILASARLIAAPLMMLEHAVLLLRGGPRWTQTALSR